MTERTNKKKKVSPKKRRKSDYKWAKVLGWDIDDLKKRVEALEKTVKLIKEFLDIKNGESDGE